MPTILNTQQQRGAQIGDLADQGFSAQDISKQVNAPVDEVNRMLGTPAGPRPSTIDTNQPQATPSVQFNPSDLTTNDLEKPSTNITPVEQKKNTAAAGIFGASDAIAQQTQKYLQDQAKQARTNSREILSQLQGQMEKLATKGQRTAQLEKDAGIANLTESLTSINNDIITKKRQFENERRALLEAPGLTTAQKQDQLDAMDRTQAHELADLSIQSLVAQNRLNSAQSLVNRKVDLEFGDTQARIDALKFFYDENKDIFTKAEDRLYQSRLQEEKQKFELAKQDYQNIESTKLNIIAQATQNGAPRDVITGIQNATSIDQAYNVAGSFAKDPMIAAQLETERLRQQKLQGDIAAQTASTEGLPQQYQVDTAQRTINSAESLLQEAIKNPGIFGRTAALPLPDFARTDAFRNFKAQLTTLKANVFANQINAMRQASKTGGAVGNVSDAEGDRFANALGALEMDQSPKNIQKQLLIIKDSTQKWMDAVNKAGGTSTYAPPQTGGQTVTAPDGTEVIITD